MFAGKIRPLLFRVRLKVLARTDLVSLEAVGRVEMSYRITVRESRRISRLQQSGSYTETEMRVAESCLRAARKEGEGQRAWGRVSGSEMKLYIC